MASKFAITAELNLQTKNLSQVVNNLKRQFQGIDLNIKIKDLASAESQVRGIGTAADGARKSIGLLGNSINEGVKKFAIVTIATGTFVGLTRAVKNAVGSAIEFEREMVKIAQATGKTVSQLRGLELEVGNIATGLGASSKELINAARTLTQAGFAADKVTGSLKILAQTDLAATFKSIEDTTEGAIAILNQFGREAQNTGNEVAFLERSLSAINQVSKDFAVESSDLITAVKTTGSAFESAGGSLNELIALFTSVRSTTRESAESIATGFRTIFTRVQRVDTMNNLRDLGIELQDIKGQFVGPMEAAKRLSIALSSIDPKDFRFNLIVEQLGGFRQVSKVIPLIQQITVAQKAYAVAQNSSGSLAKDAATAQQALSVQIQKTREEFLRFVKDLTQSTSFQSTVSSLLQMANAFIKVADTLKPLIPLIASFAALKIGTALLPTLGLVGGGARQKKSQGGPIGFASGGMVPGSGNGDTVPAMLTPGEFVIRKSSVKKLGVNNLARANKYAGGGPVEISATPSSRPYIETAETTHKKAEDEPITPALRNKTTPLRFNPTDQVEINLQRKEISPSKIAENNKGNAAVQAAYDKYTETVTKKDDTNRGFAFENVLVAAGELTKDAKPNSRIDGFLKNKELVEIKSSKEAKRYLEIADDAIGGAINNQGDTERVLNQRASHPELTDNKDYIDLGNVTLLQDSDVAGFKESLANRNRIDAADAAKKAKKAAQGGLIQRFALGGPAGKSRAARAITIPRIDSYTFEKPAGADLDSVNAEKQQYKLNAEDRLDYNLNTVNVDVDKLKVSKDLLERYQTGDDQNRGFRFEDILMETGMAKSLSKVSNARLDGITAAGDPFEAKSRKSAIGASELEDKLYGAISDNISDPEKLARARFNANDLTKDEDHIKIGKVTVFEDVTRGLGAAVNTKARMGYAEEEAAKQAKEQNKMASVKAQQSLQDLVKNNFGSGFIIQGKQYSPVTKSDKVHPDVPMNLNQLLGGKYQDTLGLNGGPAKVLELLKTFIVRNPVQKKASGGPIADLAWLASGGAASGTDTVPAMLTPGEYVINKKSAQAIGYGKLNRMNKVGKFANGGQVQYLSRGGEAGTKGIPNAPLVDDILQATGAILPNPKNAIAKIKEAGGASLDMDRTLLRTIGDLAYGKAKTPEEKLAVLKKYFFDDAARLRDVKSAKITQFGIALQDAVKNKEIDPKTLSVISKSDRTPGLPEFLQKLFGISPANMVFTGGKNKQPAVDMFREKGAFLANGGNIPGEGNQDTVPAMLTPGEYVINKKSAQAIGYGSLNRMNKVGKFASGGPVGVQRFAGGGPVLDAETLKKLVEIRKLGGTQGPTATGGALGGSAEIKTFLKMVDALNKAGIDASQFIKEGFAEIKKDATNFKISKELKATYQQAKVQAKAAPAPTATENAAKLKAELDGIINKGSAVSNGLVILASTVAGVVSQMSGLDKETADFVTALTGTFATINGIGQNLKNMGFAQLASMKSDREHRAAVEADKKALEQHASAVSGTTSTGDEQPSKFASRLNLASKAAEGAILGYAAAQALSAAKIAATNARADKASESLGRAMEKFAASANNEAEVRNGMIKTLMLSEEAQAEYKASISTEANVGGAAGGGIGAIIGGALGSLGGPAGTAIGVQVGATIGSFAGTFFGTELAKNFDGAKVTAAAKGISGAFTTASKGILDTNKYFEKIEGKDLNNVNQQFSKMNTELAKAQAELSSFDPSILTTGSEQIKAQFNKAADTVRNFENVIGRLAGVQLQKLTMLMSDMAKLGQNFDIGPAIKAQQDQITKVLNAKYNPDIARATKAGKGELAKGLTNQRDQEIAQGTRQFEKSLLEVRLQILETEKSLIKERAARDAVIGTLVQEKALKTTLQNFKFAVQQAGKSVDQLDAAFSNSVSGLKSAIPSGDVFDLEMPDAADLEPALAALRTIGPIGEKLATNLTDLNTVIPNLETGLESLAKTQATGGAGNDIKKLVEDTVEKGFGVSIGSAVGKRLSEIIQDRITGKGSAGGSVENANPSILSANTREAITKEFTDYAQAIKSMSKETLQVWAAAEEEQRKILDKINESENRKLELTNQGVDSYGRMVEAVSKAYGKNVPLAVKNMQRFAKQFNSIGKTAYSSIQDIGKNLKQAKGQLAQGVKDPLEAGKLQSTANRLEQSLKTLANQSDRAGDTLAELEKFKAQREAITSAGTSYAFGSDEQRKSKDDATVALQQVMAAGGDLDAVSSDMRGQIDSLLGELGDAGKNIKKQLTANFFAKRGNTDMANMVMSESSGPEQKLIAELQTIYQEEIAAQKELKDLEIMHGQGMITGLAQVTNQIAGFNDQLKARVQKGEKGAQDIQKAAGVTDSKMTVKEIDEIINSTKTSLTKVEENIATFAKYLGELNEYLAFVKDPEAFKKTGAPIPAKPGAVPLAKAKGGIIYKADGGFTPRGTDTVPAMLTPGEFVIQKSAVDSIGVGNLEAMNNGYADGGLVSYFRRGGRAMNYGRSANNKRQRAIARRDERRTKKAQEMQQQSVDQSFNQASTASVQGLGADPMQALQPSAFNTNVVANPSPVSVPDLQRIYDDRQKSDAQFNPLAVVESIKEQQRQQALTAELARQNEIAKVKNKKAMDEETNTGLWGNLWGNIKQKFGYTGGISESQQAANTASYQGELESQKNASGFIEKGLEFTRGVGVGAGQGVTGLANVGASAVDLAGRQVGVDVGANAAVTSVQNAAFGSQESLKSSVSQVGSFVGRTGAVALQAGVGLAPQAAATATATAFGTQAVTDIGLTALNDSGALDNFSEGQKAGVGMLTSALLGRKTKKLAPNSINNQSLTGSIARGAVSKAGNLKDAAVSRAGKVKDSILGPRAEGRITTGPKTSDSRRLKAIAKPVIRGKGHKSAELAGEYSQPKLDKNKMRTGPYGVLPRGTPLSGSPSNKPAIYEVLPKGTPLSPPEKRITTRPKTSSYADNDSIKEKANKAKLYIRNLENTKAGEKSTNVPEYPKSGGSPYKVGEERSKVRREYPENKPNAEHSNLSIHEQKAEVVSRPTEQQQKDFQQWKQSKGHFAGDANEAAIMDILNMASGGLVEYHARGGRAGARARAAQRRQNKMQAEQEFPSMAQVGPQNVHRDLAGTPVTRSVMDNPQNFAQASNARSRKAAMRGVPGYLGEMAGMGQMIHVGADSEESKARTKYSSSGANQFAEGEERQAMLKDIADARQRDKDKYSPERMKSLYGEKNATPAANYKRPPGKGWNWDPTAKKFVNENPQSTTTTPKPPASNMGATAPKPKYDGYTNREYSKSNKPLTAVEKAMQAARPGWRSANFANGGAVHLARGGRVGGYSGGGKIRRYQDGGSVDPYAESGGGGGSEAPQMPDMSGFSKSIESLTAFVGSFDGFSKTMAGLASQLSSVTVTHNVTFGGQVNVGGISGEGIVNAMKSTIEGWVKDQISKHPDVKKAVESSDQTRKG